MTTLRLQRQLPDRFRDMAPQELEESIVLSKIRLGKDVMILGHHYQRDEVMQFADARGDSFRLSVLASESDAKYIVFCGVHFMAESADILTSDEQTVVLPDLNAGCSMADMAHIDEVEEMWEWMGSGAGDYKYIPITYMNSSAAIKAFVGRMGGAVCTSTNARAVIEWALTQGDKVAFFPDQHLGRNTGYQMGFGAEDMVVWNPHKEMGGIGYEDLRERTFFLWKGHCSIHQRFKPQHIRSFRQAYPDGIVLTHPECPHETCELADAVGSTDFIIKAVERAPEGSVIAVGTEIHLVSRLAFENPSKTILSLDPIVCPCSTMSRIDLPHLAWIMEGLADGKVRNSIKVDDETSRWAKVALQRMLDIT